MMDFSWLSETVNAIRAFFPRREIIRNTHRGVKWSRRKPKELGPGVRWYWPLVSDVEVIPVARQALGLSTQTLTTKDGKTVAAGGVVVYHIHNVLLAIGEKNYDVDDTIAEVSRAAIVSVVNQWKFNELFADLDDIKVDLTKECRKQLRKFGVAVESAALTDFCTCRPISLLGIPEKPE